jgi:hypothetical protein
MIAQSFAVAEHDTQANATIFPPLHCRRKKNIARVSVA